MLAEISEGFAAMIEGGTDTEHFAALYLSYLCKPKNHLGAEEYYDASKMWNALQAAIHKVQKIQKDRGFEIKNIDNYLNICTSMF